MSRNADRKPLYQRAVLWIPIFVVIIGAIVVVLVGGAILAKQALAVKNDLNDAMPLVSSIQKKIVSGDVDDAKDDAEKLRKHTAQAEDDAGGFLWDVGEHVPKLGNNLIAVRTTTEVADSLANDVVSPLTEFSISDIKPDNGTIDVSAIEKLGTSVTKAYSATQTAQKTMAGIDRDGLFGPVTSALEKVEPKLNEAADLLESAKTATDVLPDALGADGPRDYLLLFQNNAESRGTGGNPASLLLLNVTDGKISIAKQASSTDFDNNRAEPITDIDESTTDLYGSKIGRYMMDMTLTPDFPTTAEIAKAWWAEYDDTEIDGVLSFDPVALSYLLKATGPVELETGDTLTPDNAVSLLLNEAYYRYPDPEVQDLFFAAAAGSVFEALTQSDDLDVKEVVTQLGHAVDEGRLLFHSADTHENELIDGTRIAGELPSSNDEDNIAGVYIGDTTGSKMDYYLDVSVEAKQTCTRDKSTTPTTVSLKNTVDPGEADSLPDYIQGPYFEHGRIATDVYLYAPLDSDITDLTVNGKKAKPAYEGTDLGRKVMKVSVKTDPAKKTEIGYTLTGTYGENTAPLEFWHTPMVHDTPVDVARCEN